MIATNTTSIPFFEQRPHDKISLSNANAVAVAAASVLKQPIPEVAVVEPAMLQRPLEQQPLPVAAPAEELPENYASLPQNTKLDEEPNPFEKSFSDISSTPATKAATTHQAAKPVLPPVASMDSPSKGAPTFKKSHVDPYAWGSLRAGPLSPSMLQGPVNGNPVPFNPTTTSMKQVEPDEFVPYQPQIPTSMQYNFQAQTANAPGPKFGVYQQPTPQPTVSKTSPAMQQMATFTPQTYQAQPPNAKAEQRTYQSTEFIYHDNGVSSRKSSKSSNAGVSEPKPTTRVKRQEHGELLEGLGPVVKKNKSSVSEQDEDEKRRNFLERNRQAALKCRQRKKAWLNDLQVKVEDLAHENEQLTAQANSFRDEIIHLRTLLLAHKDCPVNKDNGSLIRLALEKPLPPPISPRE
ncbi:Transcription factor [Umbelopsis sp. WA50703]